VIGHKCAEEVCVSSTRYWRVPIVQLTYTNSSVFVVRFSVHVCVPGIHGPRSILLLCFLSTVSTVLQSFPRLAEAVVSAVSTVKALTGWYASLLIVSSQFRFPICKEAILPERSLIGDGLMPPDRNWGRTLPQQSVSVQ
jgi:hypothetical protein